MAGWRDNLRPASFRGVPFEYESADDETGRTLAVHRYPRRDVPYVEDMGKKTDTFTMIAWVFEPDHLGNAARLRAACNAPGPGKLVHPYYGELQVACDNCQSRYSTREGGMVTLTLSFVEAGKNTFPVAKPDTKSQVAAASNTALTDIKSVFTSSSAGGFSVNGAPAFVEEAAKTLFGDFVTQTQTQLTPALSPGLNVADFTRKATSIVNQATTLIRDPARLVDSVAGLMGTEIANPVNARRGFNFLDDYAGTLTPIAATTATRARQAANQAAMAGLFSRMALVMNARNVSERTFTSLNEAQSVRTDLLGRIESHLLVAEDPVFRSLQNVMSSVTRDIAARTPMLPRLVSVTPRTVKPAIALAYDLYGDRPETIVDRMDEMIARNGIVHAGFVPADPIEVLSDA